MVTQNELKAWMSTAVMLFAKHEPLLSVRSLEYEIFSERNIYEKLSSLIRKIDARENAEELLEWESPAMLLHGAFTDVIVLRQKLFPDPKKDEHAYEAFEHLVWVELSRSIVINANDRHDPEEFSGERARTLYSYLYADTEGAFDLCRRRLSATLLVRKALAMRR